MIQQKQDKDIYQISSKGIKLCSSIMLTYSINLTI